MAGGAAILPPTSRRAEGRRRVTESGSIWEQGVQEEMRQRFVSWAEVTGTERAAERAERTGERHPLA